MRDILRLSVFGLLVILGISSANASDGDPRDMLDQFARPAVMDAPAYKFNPTTPEKVAAGEKLFFDPKLSATNTISCATCHVEEHGWTDLDRFSIGHDGAVMQRRTQTLLGVGWSNRFGWDGGIDSLEGFSLAPIARSKEMNQDLDFLVDELRSDPAYQQAMQDAFGDPVVKISRISQSLAAFMRTIAPPRTAFDDWVDGDDSALSAAAKDGFDLFVGKAGCVNCHMGWRFTDDKIHDIGLAESNDIGRAEHDPEKTKPRFAFKTPTLRGVAKRPPYMHDGSVRSLGAVVEHYVSGVVERPSISGQMLSISLTDREKLNVVFFLNSL